MLAFASFTYWRGTPFTRLAASAPSRSRISRTGHHHLLTWHAAPARVTTSLRRAASTSFLRGKRHQIVDALTDADVPNRQQIVNRHRTTPLAVPSSFVNDAVDRPGTMNSRACVTILPTVASSTSSTSARRALHATRCSKSCQLNRPSGRTASRRHAVHQRRRRQRHRADETRRHRQRRSAVASQRSQAGISTSAWRESHLVPFSAQRRRPTLRREVVRPVCREGDGDVLFSIRRRATTAPTYRINGKDRWQSPRRRFALADAPSQHDTVNTRRP